MLALLAFCAVVLSWLWYFTSFEETDDINDLKDWLKEARDYKPNEPK